MECGPEGTGRGGLPKLIPLALPDWLSSFLSTSPCRQKIADSLGVAGKPKVNENDVAGEFGFEGKSEFAGEFDFGGEFNFAG